MSISKTLVYRQLHRVHTLHGLNANFSLITGGMNNMNTEQKLDKQYTTAIKQYNDLNSLVDAINELTNKINSLVDYYNEHGNTEDEFIKFLGLVKLHDELCARYEHDCDDIRIDSGLLLAAIRQYKKERFNA